ncbi:MAG TPA: ATP-binding protein [Azospirillum sp.]
MADPAGTRPFIALRGRAEVLLLDGPLDRDRLAALLAELDGDGEPLLVELDEDGGTDGGWRAVPAPAPGFLLSLTTATAFAVQSPVAVCDALARRGVLPDWRRSAVELCLHEAVANALLHGNLGVPCGTRDGPDGLRLFGERVGVALRDPAVRRRRVDILACWGDGGLDLAVADEGGGFDPAALARPAEGFARSGRGFIFMRALADAVVVCDGGRRTRLRFDLKGADA